MKQNSDILVIGEISDGKLMSITSELLGCGRQLADQLGEELILLLLGEKLNTCSKHGIHMGADKVLAVEDTNLAEYRTDTYLQVVERVYNSYLPRIILMGQTSSGRDLAPILAFRLKTVAEMDCIDLSIDSETKLLLQTRPVYGGSARAVFTSECLPQIATIRSKTMSPAKENKGRKGDVIQLQSGLIKDKIRTRIIEKKKQKTEGIRLEDAAVVVGGGRGIGGPEGFKELEKLAKILKGAVGASRPPCDSEWVPNDRLIGLTGKIIVPDLYIAVAVSGASQHMSGCSTAKNIIAINKDEEANIFREARYGVIGDWKKILPAFTEKLKELFDS